MTGLIRHWPLNGDGSTAYDIANDDDGSITGSSSGHAGPGGLQCRRFTESGGGYMSGPSFSPANWDAISISVWIKPETLSYSSNKWFMSWFQDSSNRFGLNLTPSGNLRLFSQIGGTSYGNTGWKGTLEPNEWNHIVGVIKDGVKYLYHNGELIDARDMPLSISNLGTGDLFINEYNSSTSNNYHADVQMSDLRIYDRELSSSEVKDLYSNGSQAKQPLDGVSRWKLNGDATDEWGGNDGTVNGATPAVGKFGKCYSFDGVDDQITADISQLSLTDSFTYCYWAKIDDSDGYPRLLKDFNTQANRTKFDSYTGNSGNLRAFWRDTTNDNRQYFPDAKYNEGVWAHYTFIYDGTQNYTFKNGVPVGAQSTSNSPHPSDVLSIGSSDGSDYLNGKLEDVRIYDRPLKDWEIKAIYEGTQDAVGPINDPITRPETGIAKYRLDSSATDTFGSNDGTVTGAVFVDGKNRGAASFDGTDDYIEVPNMGIFDGSQPFSISAWARLEESVSNSHVIFGSHGEYYWELRDSGYGMWQFLSYDGSTHTVQSSNTVGEWHHLTGTYDPNTGLELFVDGESVGTNSWTGTPSTQSSINSIGARANIQWWFNGEIDDLRIYNRVLSQDEIDTLATPVDDEAPLAHYELNGNVIDTENEFDGTNDGVTFVNGVRGQAGSFDGVSNDITVSDNGAMSGMTELTQSVWFKPNDLSDGGTDASTLQSISVKGRTSGAGKDDLEFDITIDPRSSSRHLVLKSVDSVPNIFYHTIPLSELQTGEWHHAVQTYDANQHVVYLNGEVRNTQVTAGNPLNSVSYPLRIGGDNGQNNRFFNGEIDDVRIYDRALTMQEVRELYQYGTRGTNLIQELIQ